MAWFLHKFKLSKALPWTINSSPSFLNCFGGHKAIKKHQNLTQLLETIARAPNMLIGLKGNNYYSMVFKRANYKLQNSIFWVVINHSSSVSLLALTAPVWSTTLFYYLVFNTNHTQFDWSKQFNFIFGVHHTYTIDHTIVLSCFYRRLNPIW